MMTRREASELINREARGALRGELEYHHDDRADDRDPADWPDGYDWLDALEDADGHPVVEDSPAMRREVQRLRRLIGMDRKVREGEEVLITNCSGSRRLKPGQWINEHAYSDYM